MMMRDLGTLSELIRVPVDKHYAKALVSLKQTSRRFSNEDSSNYEGRKLMDPTFSSTRLTSNNNSRSQEIKKKNTILKRTLSLKTTTSLIKAKDEISPFEMNEPFLAKLQGTTWNYYLRQFSIILGRKTATSLDVDVDLGSSKIVSRRHAKIEYNDETKKWELKCLGKNPVIVNGSIFGLDVQNIELRSK